MSKELEQAELLFKQFKHKEAYPLFEKLADAGEARAMYFMGIYSRLYLGVGHFDQEKFIQKADSGIVMAAPHEQVDKAALAQMIVIMRAAFFDRSLIF